MIFDITGIGFTKNFGYIGLLATVQRTAVFVAKIIVTFLRCVAPQYDVHRVDNQRIIDFGALASSAHLYHLTFHFSTNTMVRCTCAQTVFRQLPDNSEKL